MSFSSVFSAESPTKSNPMLVAFRARQDSFNNINDALQAFAAELHHANTAHPSTPDRVADIPVTREHTQHAWNVMQRYANVMLS